MIRCLLACVLAVGAALSAPRKATAGPYGLWVDNNGGLWCGGTCGTNQQCCTISPPK
jgi:hypothetical protein